MSIVVDVRVDKGDFALDASFSAPAVGFTAISGPSGGGKTTLLRAIAGLERAARGTVRIGDDCWLDGVHDVPTHRRAIGYVFQQATLFAHLSVRGNLEFGARHRRGGVQALSFAQVVELLGLSRLVDRSVDGLSGGERQRVAIGQALLSRPELLLMDEPMASLDRAARQTLLPYLEALQRALDIPVLYVSHALDEIARLADHLVLLQAGRVTASGPVNELMTRLDLPMAHGREASAVISGIVAGHDDDDHLTEVRFSGGALWVPRVDLPPGTRVRLRVLSRDVTLSLMGDGGSSIMNRFPVEVAGLVEAGPAEHLLSLRAGDDLLLTRVSRRSRRELAVEVGTRLFAQVRSVATLV